jgi:hypothetical protein
MNRGHCRFCGSSEVADATYEMREPEVEIGVTAPIAHVPINLGVRRGSSGTLLRRTRACRVCCEIEVESNHRPKEVEGTIDGEDVRFVIPLEFEVLLRTQNVTTQELTPLLEEIRRRAKRPYRNFRRIGTNPCRRRHMGSSISLNVQGLRTKLFLVFESGNLRDSSPFVRIVYGGGKASCP